MVCAFVGEIIIEEGPQSLLIPTGEVGTFACKARCFRCLSHWIIIINGTRFQTTNDGNQSYLNMRGFTASASHSSVLNESTITLSVSVSESVNGSRIHCMYEPVGDHSSDYVQSDAATLLVIASKYQSLRE